MSSQIKRLFLIGEVTSEMSKLAISELLETPWKKENIKELHVIINSEGGFITDCFAIIDVIELLKKQFSLRVTTMGTGMIASAGFFLFLLGDVRVLTQNCRIFVHEHMAIEETEKTYSERLRSDKTDQKDTYETYLNYTMRRLNLPKRKARLLLRKNKWLNIKEMTTFGIIIGDINAQ
jgi:ATP-dependent protease ClpP protease subunit